MPCRLSTKSTERVVVIYSLNARTIWRLVSCRAALLPPRFPLPLLWGLCLDWQQGQRDRRLMVLCIGFMLLSFPIVDYTGVVELISEADK